MLKNRLSMSIVIMLRQTVVLNKMGRGSVPRPSHVSPVPPSLHANYKWDGGLSPVPHPKYVEEQTFDGNSH